jgi:hydrogenase-4 component E
VSPLESFALTLVLVTDVWLTSASRLGASIRVVALQGAVIGVLPLLHQSGGSHATLWVLAGVTVAVKGLVLPRLLSRALREVRIRREMEPIIGPVGSLLLGAVGLALSAWLGWRLPLPDPTATPLLVPVALFTILSGLFLIVARRKAITQVLGYLVFENGIFAFGVAIAKEQPLLVELGVLLDVFVAIIVFHIQREFDHIDVDRLSLLRDLTDTGELDPPLRPDDGEDAR